MLDKVMSRLNRHNLLPEHQSDEMTVRRVLSNLLHVAGAGQMSLLILPDLPAAFDTVDHGIILGQLEMGCALHGFGRT